MFPVIGLKYMHDCGYAHLDFKPDNVLCYSDGNHITVEDFGHTTKLDKDGNCSSFGGGTNNYNSPEASNNIVPFLLSWLCFCFLTQPPFLAFFAAF